MDIRGKLLFPLVFLGLSFAVLLHFYWLPQFRDSETVELQNRSLKSMELLAAALSPPLLSGDLAQIHATIDQLLERQSGWEVINLKTPDERYLYPLTPTSAGRQEDGGQWLRIPIDFNDKHLATLEVKIDIDTMLANPLEQIHALERLLLAMLLGIAALTALLQDRWIRRPLKTLVSATSHIAQGDFELALPTTSARDEVAKLVTSFEAMRANLQQREAKLAHQHTLLSAISAAQSRFIRDTDAKRMFDKLLTDILNLTDSEYGFIGEVLYRDNEPYLKTFAISNIAWNDEMRQFYEDNAPRGMEFTNLNTLFGAAISERTPVITNTPASDPRAGGLPDGHPALDAFLGIPFRRGDNVIGMFGIANRPGGYDTDLVASLEPLTTTCTQIVEALKADRQRVGTEEQLRERETRMRTIFENVADGIITTNDRGIIESFNRAAEQLFGYSAEEVIGRNISILTPSPHRELHDGYIEAYFKGRPSKIFATGREVEGVRKDGSLLPIDIAVNDMWVGEERLFCSIMRDITERRKVDRLKNEFVSTVSHELRTPLTSIRGSLGLLAGGAAGELSQKARSLLEIASNNTERLLLLINDILDIEKIESGQMAFKFTNIRIADFLSHAVEANEAYASQHNARFMLGASGENLAVYADPDRLMQVMNNLLSNAVKFSPEGGTIDITAGAREGLVRLSITDQGPGIPEEFQPKLFDKFTQSDASDTRRIGGTGLGLNIAKTIVEKHGGHISFISQEGIGTTFHVDLPAIRGSGSSGGTDTPAATEDQAENRILVVEDDQDVASVLSMMLAQSGFSAEIALDARQAKQKLGESSYAAITLDIMLPDQDGISLIRDLREQEATRNLPIIVISAKADIARREVRGGAVSVVDWLNKPIDRHRLVSAVNQLAVPRNSPVVLHVEDEPDVHMIVSAMLKDTAKVVWAPTLMEARQQLADQAFDLVLLDIGLPDGSAVALLDTLNHGSPPVPTVMFSAQDIDKTLAQRVSAALVKSSTSNEDLVATIQSLLPITHARSQQQLNEIDSVEVDAYEQ
jgi:PAS domain S-box-containing protein